MNGRWSAEFSAVALPRFAKACFGGGAAKGEQHVVSVSRPLSQQANRPLSCKATEPKAYKPLAQKLRSPAYAEASAGRRAADKPPSLQASKPLGQPASKPISQQAYKPKAHQAQSLVTSEPLRPPAFRRERLDIILLLQAQYLTAR
jgi:hypothetical protein